MYIPLLILLIEKMTLKINGPLSQKLFRHFELTPFVLLALLMTMLSEKEIQIELEQSSSRSSKNLILR